MYLNNLMKFHLELLMEVKTQVEIKKYNYDLNFRICHTSVK